MRTTPPHLLIRYRHVLLGVALIAWAVAGFVLLQFKGNPVVPVAALVALCAFVFIWANGAYWWVLCRYPYIEVTKGQFVSRDEWRGESHALFLKCYFLVAVFASIACANVALRSPSG